MISNNNTPKIDEDDGLVAGPAIVIENPHFKPTNEAENVNITHFITTRQVSNQSHSQTESNTKKNSKKPKTKSHQSNNRMQPINDRIRSVFEIVRNRLNINPSSSSTLPASASTNLSHQKRQTKNKKINSSSQLANNNRPSLATHQTNQTVIDPKIPAENETEEICNLCFDQCNILDKLDGSNHMYSIETCEHSFCVDCLRQYLKYQIIESRVSLSCPQCSEKMHPSDIYKLLSFSQESGGANKNDKRNSALMTPSSPVSQQSTNSLLKSNTPLPTITNQPIQDWPQLIQKYEEFMLRRVLVTIADTRWCPAPDCTYAVIATGCANCPQLYCMRPNCNTSFCYHCKQRWHPNLTCEDAALKNNQNGLSSIFNMNFNLNQDTTVPTSSTNKFRSFMQRSNSHISQASSNGVLNSITGNTTVMNSRNTNGDWVKEEIKRCPKCQALIVKMDDGSCNHITCSVCGCEFCWLCMKEISDLHYLSPSGCTFWGKKPWSRKKKIMWQLGTLIGAPVGIALIAGVAVPAILIGLPIWSGRKVYIRYKTIGKHKRNLIVIGTVLGTILVAPLVASLAVGIGVPILLAYVYGVVPISLCRSGGCGVTTNNNGGVRFAFDDEATDSPGFFNFSSTTAGAAATNQHQQAANTFIKANEKPKEDISVFNSVIIPISAIEPKQDSVVVSTLSNSNDAISSTISTSKSSSNQTPLFVTITMANSKTNTSNQKSKSKHRNRSSSTSSSNRKRNSTNNSNKQKENKALNTLNSVSVACGSVELPELEQNKPTSKRRSSSKNKSSLVKPIAAETQTETGAAGSTLSSKIITNFQFQSSDFDLNSNTSISSTSSSSSSSSPSSHKLLDDLCSNGPNLNEIQAKNEIQHLVKKKSSNLSNKGALLNENKINKIISSRFVNNPSIGDVSIGIASFGQFYDSEEDIDFIQDISSSNKKNLFNSTKSNEKSILKASNEDRSDRDSASNKAIASESINRYSNYLLDNKSKKSLNFELSDKKDVMDTKFELKSTYTVNSYEKIASSPTADLDTCSVSIVSEKSVNPSVSALVGSIK